MDWTYLTELPTKEELNKLSLEKGEDALIWYIWRNSIRAMPIFGLIPFRQLLNENDDLIPRLYQLLHVPIVLSSWQEDKLSTKKALSLNAKSSFNAADQTLSMLSDYINERKEISGFTSTAEQIASGQMTVASYALNGIGIASKIYIEISNFFHDESSIVDLAFITAELAAKSEHHLNAALAGAKVLDERSFTEGFDEVFNIAARYVDSIRDQTSLSANSASSKQDFDELLQNGIHWHGKQLWAGVFIEEYGDSQVTKMNSLFGHLLDYFSTYKYTFLADDLKKVFHSTKLDTHAKNYLKSISETDIRNPSILRRRLFEEVGSKIHAVRVLLLGPGGAGKSSLADLLQGKPVNHRRMPTSGIEYLNHKPLRLHETFSSMHSNDEEKDLSLYLWDFGGQTIFHGLHRTFLHENCVYILVVDSRHEQAPDEWLHQIRHIAGSATVLLVTNQHDGCGIHQNETRLLREFPDLLDNNSFHYFSCIDSKTSELTTFVNELTKAAQDSQKTVWKETLKIHQAIQEYTEQKSAVFISMAQIKKIIHENGRVEDSKAMINSLEQLGFLASITKGKLSYCLKPEWAVDRAYELLYSNILRDNQGKLHLLDFDECFATEPTEEQQDKLLEFLDYRSLCFELPESGEYFFPDAATADEPDKVADLLIHQQQLQVRFDLPYLPLGFHTRLVKPLFNQEAGIKDSGHIWRQGFITQLANSYAVVQYLLRKSSVEVTLIGAPEHYADLLDKFYSALSSALAENRTGLMPSKIRSFVFLEKGLFELDRTKDSQAFSVHSVVELVKVLQAANGDLKQIYEDVRDMAADKKSVTNNAYYEKVYNTKTTGDGQTVVGSKEFSTIQCVNKPHTELTADQRNRIVSIVDELLKDAGSLSPEQLIAVAETQKALKAPADDETSQNLLSKVWSGIDQVATFTKDKALPITDFVIKHKELLGNIFLEQ